MHKYLSLFSTLLLACLFTVGSAVAQDRGPDPRGPEPEDRGTGVSAGGNWMVFESEDAMTAAKLVRFELESNNTMPDSDRRSKIILYCKNGKLDLSDFRPNLRMSGPNRPGFWGQPQMEVTVRVDNAHDHKGWNWVGGRFLSMDKGTTRELIGAHLFRVEFLSRRGPQIAEFSPAGLDLGKVRHACDITPKRP
jgi:hypothetical protein